MAFYRETDGYLQPEMEEEKKKKRINTEKRAVVYKCGEKLKT